MHATQRKTIAIYALTASIGLAGCAGMSERQKATAIGAGVGGVAGSVISGGSTAGTVGGAVVGGVVGNEVGKDREKR